MVARKFQVRHNDADFVVDYDTDDGFEVLHFSLSLSLKTLSVSLSKIVNCCCFLQTLKFQLFSLTSVVPDDQKVLSLSTCLCVYIYIQEFVVNCVFTDHRRRRKSSLIGRLRSHFGFRETQTCIGQR